MTKVLFAAMVVLTIAIFLGFVASYGAFSKTPNQDDVTGGIPAGSQVQEIFIRATAAGVYDKPVITVKKGVPVKLNFSADPNSGCGRGFLMRDFGVDLISRNGETVTATFLPQKEGNYEFSCSMRMFRGTLNVVP